MLPGFSLLATEGLGMGLDWPRAIRRGGRYWGAEIGWTGPGRLKRSDLRSWRLWLCFPLGV